MQHKRGNPRRLPRKRYPNRQAVSITHSDKPLEVARLTLHETDPITGHEEQLSSLFYEYYRGYTIYSTQQGRCCIHGPGQGGCLRIQNKYVYFPDVEQAKTLMKHFQAAGRTPQESMNRYVPEDVYRCLNRFEPSRRTVASPTRRVS